MRGGRRAILLLVGMLFVLSVGVRLLHYHRGWKHYRVLFFYHERPLLVGFDAYYYLRLTRDFLTGHYQKVDELRPAGTRPNPPPLLVCLTVWLHRITGIHYEWLAFFLPPILGSLMVVPLYLWGSVLAGRWGGVLAALFGATNYYWYVRTPLGRFDTDSLLPFFVFLIPYGFWLAARGRRKLAAALIVADGLLFLWWWPHAKIFLPFLLLWSYAGTFFLVRKGKWLRLLAGLSPLFFLPFIWHPELLPGQAKEIFLGIRNHLLLLTGWFSGPLGVRISELKPLTLSFLTKFIGHPVLLLAAGCSLVLLWRARWRELVCLAGPLALALLSLVARRFAIYLVPFYALALGFLFVWLGRGGRKRAVIAGVLALLAVGLNARLTVEKTVSPLVNKWHAELAETLGERTPPRTTVWCWWDYGYFVQYYAKRRTFADGGAQHPWRLVSLAVPFAVKDAQLAANWMEYFTVHGPKVLWAWINEHREPDEFARLADLLRQRKPPFPRLKWPSNPPALALFLPFQMLGQSSWTRFGHFYEKDLKALESRFLRRDFSLDVEKGLLRFRTARGEETRLLKELYYLYFSPWPKIRNRLLYDRNEGGVFVSLLQVPFGYFFDEKTARSLAVRLLLFAPKGSAPFSLLDYKPLQGGAWRVERGLARERGSIK